MLGSRETSGALMCLVVAIGCRAKREVLPTSPTTTRLSDMVTPQLATRLTDGGSLLPRFGLDSDAGRQLLTSSAAAQLAVAYVRQFGPYLLGHIVSLHGGPVDLETLRADSATMVAESPYEALPEGEPGFLRKWLGPYYLVTLRNDAYPVLSIAVSAYATDLRLLDGKIGFSGAYGAEFRTWVIPRSRANEPVMSPEQAVSVAFGAFGERVAEPPRLVRRGYAYVPQLGYWRIRLAGPVRVRESASGRESETETVYVDAKTGVLAIAGNASDTAVVRLPAREPRTTRLIDVREARGFSTSYQLVVPATTTRRPQ